MAGDARSATGLRRQNSTASGHSSLTLQQRTPTTTSAEPVEPVSAHVTDPFLRDFLQPGFDPAAYWNATLSAAASTTSAASKPARGTSTATATADQAAVTQTALSQLAAHTTRLTTVLSQLTDDILRSGSRLAYEVELLRGETIGLAEVLDKVGQELPGIGPAADGASGPEALSDPSASTDPSAPPALAQLRMLAQVRSRLNAVIRAFGDAMEFVMPPSALSVGASFLSVSGPEAGAAKGTATAPTIMTTPNPGGVDTKSLEDKGQQVLKARREEIAQLLEGKDGQNSQDGVEAAAARVAALRALCQVWAGTAEEKARLKFVDGLQRMVEDRQRQLEREKQAEEQAAAKPAKTATSTGGRDGGSSTSMAASASSSTQDAGAASSTAAAAAQGKGGGSYVGYGFISQLQKFSGGL